MIQVSETIDPEWVTGPGPHLLFQYQGQGWLRAGIENLEAALLFPPTQFSFARYYFSKSPAKCVLDLEWAKQQGAPRRFFE